MVDNRVLKQKDMELILTLGILYFVYRFIILLSRDSGGSPPLVTVEPPTRPSDGSRTVSVPYDLIYEDENGYLRHTCCKRAVHRVVAEQKLNRRLRQEEVVHHKDRNKQNNHPSNLWVFKNQEEHDAQHRRDAEKYGFR
jgi:hypothetical protein